MQRIERLESEEKRLMIADLGLMIAPAGPPAAGKPVGRDWETVRPIRRRINKQCKKIIILRLIRFAEELSSL